MTKENLFHLIVFASWEDLSFISGSTKSSSWVLLKADFKCTFRDTNSASALLVTCRFYLWTTSL